MKTYLQDVVSFNEIKKYSQKLADSFRICNKLWPEQFPLEDEEDFKCMINTSKGVFPEHAEEEWNDRSLWEAETIDIPEKLLKLFPLIKPAVKSLIVVIHATVKTQER